MDEQQQAPSSDGYLETQRSTIRKSFDEIVSLVSNRMHDAHLSFPLGLTIPSSGYAFLSMMTPSDPSEHDWEQASAIVQKVISEKLGGIRLFNRHLPCAMVNAKFLAAEVVANTLSFDMRS